MLEQPLPLDHSFLCDCSACNSGECRPKQKIDFAFLGTPSTSPSPIPRSQVAATIIAKAQLRLSDLSLRARRAYNAARLAEAKVETAYQAFSDAMKLRSETSAREINADCDVQSAQIESEYLSANLR